MRWAEQRRSGTRQAAQTPVAAAQDAHSDQTALQLGHRTLPVPQPDAGETPTRAEKAPHVLAFLAETVTLPPLRRLHTGLTELMHKLNPWKHAVTKHDDANVGAHS